MSENPQIPLTESQQTFRVAYLAVCFLVLFLSYCSLQNLFSTLCEQYGYHNLGQAAILVIYFAAFCSTPLTSLIIKKIGFKFSFFLCSLGFMTLDFSALFMALYTTQDSRFFIQILVCIGAFACGFSASLLWVAQGGYVSRLANEANKNQMFALFWSIIVTNQIFGNLMGAFILGKFSKKQYFFVLSCLATMVFIGLGVAQVATGFSYRKFTNNLNKFKLATVGSLIVQLSGIVSLICYFQRSYWLCFVAAMLWGACQVFNQTNTSVMVSILFKEKVEGFAVSRIFYCIGITLFLLFNILMSDVGIATFVTLFIILQTFGTVISLNLKYLSNEFQEKLVQKE